MNSQFKIRNLLVWTSFLAIVFASLTQLMHRVNDTVFAVFIIFVFVLPWTCSVHLINRLLDTSPHRDDGEENAGMPADRDPRFLLSPFWQAWFVVCLAVFSMVMLMLATAAFAPDWKNAKGPHWGYYLLDGWAGFTLWPIHLAAVVIFSFNLFGRFAQPFRQLASAVVLLVISYAYVIACVFFNFIGTPDDALALVPLSTGTGYLLYAINVVRHGNISAGWFSPTQWMISVGSIIAALIAKIPLAMMLYEELPDDRPEGCFIVSAAARGTPAWVGAEIDAITGNVDNQQLRTFRAFEARLRRRSPAFHRWLRRVYNIVGPIVAACIWFRWQANLMYCLLKPGEWIVAWLLRRIK